MKKIFSLFVAMLFSVAMFAIDSWTVAGEPASILGSEWNTGDTNNDLVAVAGTSYYKLVKKFDALTSKTALGFKIVGDHAWSTAYPSDNFWIDLPVGTDSVMFTFDTETKNVGCFGSCTVSGSSTNLFGTSWDVDNTDNDMTFANNVFTLTKSNVTLPAGNIEFKIVVNHYKYSYPADNYVLNIPSSGKYNVTITLDAFSHAVSANAELQEEEVVVPAVAVKGAWDDWAETTPLVIAGNKETASVTLTDIPYGQYYFGVEVDGNFKSKAGTIIRTSNSLSGITDNEGGMLLDVDQTGDYTFTWTYATNELTVTYLTEYVEAKFYITGDSMMVGDARKWNPKAIKVESDSYTFTSLPAGDYKMKISLDGTWDNIKGYSNLTDKSDAGLIADGSDNITFRLLDAADVTVTYTADPAVFTVTTTGSFFSKEAGYYLIGEFSGVKGWAVENLVAEKKFTETVEDGQYSLLVTLAVGDLIKVVKVSNNAIETWYGETNYEITSTYAGKKIIYFKPAGDGSWEQLDGYIWIGDDPTTAIDEVEGAVKAVKAVKRVVNGQLVIEREGKFYNALGAEVK